MKVFITVFILLLTVGYKFAEGRCFDPNHIEACNDVGTKCFCRTCLSCPPGFGQNYECGGKSIKTSQKLKCVRCVPGTTYSDTNSSAMCSPCPQCHGHVMLRPCTSVLPTKCSPDICDERFVWNDVVEMCEPGQTPITTPTHTTTTTTATPVPTPATPTPTSQAVTPRTPSSNTSLPKTPSMKQPNDGPVLTSDSKSSTEHNKKIEIILIVVLAIVGVLVLAAILTCIYCWNTSEKCKSCFNFCQSVQEGERDLEEGIPLNEMQDSPHLKHENGQPVQDLEETWPSGYLLKAVSHPLRGQIEIALSNVNPPLQRGWREIGEGLGLESHELDGIESFERQVRGSKLLVVLGSQQPSLTLTEFVKALIKFKRNDLVESIKQFFRQNNDIGND